MSTAERLFPGRAPVDSAPVTVTLPAAKEAVEVGDYEGWTVIPTGWCSADCGQEITDGDLVRKVERDLWMHEACAIKRITESDADAAWLLLADAVIQRPSAFKASDIRAVLQNVARIARRTA